MKRASPKAYIISLGIFLIIMFIIGLAIKSQFDNKQAIILDVKQVCFKTNCFNVELADTKEKREQGLMYKDKLLKNNGMLFIFEKDENYPFWMKNTLLSLDIIWINSNKTVVYIEKSAIPCMKDPCTVYNPKTDARYVLEINANTTDKIGLKIGDKLEFK